jgi:chorismate mutase
MSRTEHRRRIDAIDAQLVELLAERAAVVAEIWKEKRRQGVPLADPAREAAMLGEIVELARQHGLDPQAITAVFRALVGIDLHTGERAGQPTT